MRNVHFVRSDAAAFYACKRDSPGSASNLMVSRERVCRYRLQTFLRNRPTCHLGRGGYWWDRIENGRLAKDWHVSQIEARKAESKSGPCQCFGDRFHLTA